MIRVRLILLTLFLAIFAAADTPSPDQFFSMQWALHNDGTQDIVLRRDGYHSIIQKGVPGVDIGYSEAKAEIAQMATSPVTVAVIDSGLDANHEDLKNRIADGAYNFVT